MCCGGGCGCDDCTGNILYVSEKLVSFCALTSVVICIMLTMAITMGVGIGTGYNYCFVDQKVQKPAEELSGLRSKEEQAEMNEETFDKSLSQESSFKEGRRRAPTRTNMVTTPVSTSSNPDRYTLSIKLHGNIDFSALISMLKARNKNATLELIT